jgi:hypothetical protein
MVRPAIRPLDGGASLASLFFQDGINNWQTVPDIQAAAGGRDLVGQFINRDIRCGKVNTTSSLAEEN